MAGRWGTYRPRGELRGRDGFPLTCIIRDYLGRWPRAYVRGNLRCRPPFASSRSTMLAPRILGQSEVLIMTISGKLLDLMRAAPGPVGQTGALEPGTGLWSEALP